MYFYGLEGAKLKGRPGHPTFLLRHCFHSISITKIALTLGYSLTFRFACTAATAITCLLLIIVKLPSAFTQEFIQALQQANS